MLSNSNLVDIDDTSVQMMGAKVQTKTIMAEMYKPIVLYLILLTAFNAYHPCRFALCTNTRAPLGPLS
jgi:hypothetical protein